MFSRHDVEYVSDLKYPDYSIQKDFQLQSSLAGALVVEME